MQISNELIGVTSRSFSNHSQLRQELLNKYPNAKFNSQGASLAGEALVDFLLGCTKAITALEKIDISILSQLTELKVIGKYGVGLDMIDLQAMASHGVKLGWTPGVNRRSVAELVLYYLLSLFRKMPQAHSSTQPGQWKQSIGQQASEKIIGIVGCGNVGKELIHLLKPFNCKILIHDILDLTAYCRENKSEAVSLEDLLCRADAVTIHVPLTKLTRNFLDSQKLGLMKSSSYLINTARGGLVCEASLKDLLKQNKISGAAFDVFESEPATDTDLLNLPNFLSSPHIGGSSEEAILAMGRAAILGLDNSCDARTFMQYI